MARKWPDNSAGGCWARVPARGSGDIPKGFEQWLSWAFCLEPFSYFSKEVLTLSTLGPGLGGRGAGPVSSAPHPPGLLQEGQDCPS